MSEAARALRMAARDGSFKGATNGQAPGVIQANLVVLPSDAAGEFVGFCDANPIALPLLAVGEEGDPILPGLGADIDVRTDLPAYMLHHDGVETRRGNLKGIWRDDFVAIAIGSWYGAASAIAAAGIRMRDAELGIQAGLYRTAIPTVKVGRFGGPLVVSMHHFARDDISRVTRITARLPRSNGAPIHRGDPAALGIIHPDQPDWGQPFKAEPGEQTLFWACGLTALSALEYAGLPVFATHAPGCMLVTDLAEDS